MPTPVVHTCSSFIFQGKRKLRKGEHKQTADTCADTRYVQSFLYFQYLTLLMTMPRLMVVSAVAQKAHNTSLR
jgi:hypothetical protein